MTILHWVRHGPTHEKAFVGWRDVPADLSDHAQIARLRAYLPQQATLVSSDLRRSITTADALQCGSHRRLPHDPGLREFNFGDWDGLHFSKVAELHPELSRTYWESPGDAAPPNGESWNSAADRINTAVDTLIKSHPGKTLIVVAHIGVILTQVQRALGCTAYKALSYSIDNLSVTTIKVDETWQVEIINHLP